MTYKKVVMSLGLACLVSLVGIADLYAKTKIVQKPDKAYDFKAVTLIVVPPVTSDNVQFGKVNPDRMPKIEELLKKTKESLRKHMVDGAKLSKTNIPFAYSGKKSATTLIMKYNIEEFDNGNAAARLVPLAGKAKVTLRCQFINAKTGAVVAEIVGNAKAKGSGFTKVGMDSEVLWSATNMANAGIYSNMMKWTGLTYSKTAGLKEGAKMGVKTQVDMVKEEKQEKETLTKKRKGKK